MRLYEFADNNAAQQKLSAVAEYLLGRADDSVSDKSVSIQTFVNIASDLGISVTAGQLRDLILLPPLSNYIQSIDGDDTTGKVIFAGNQEPESTVMSVDQAKSTVDAMAKSAVKKRI